MRNLFKSREKVSERINAKQLIEREFDFLISSYGYQKDPNVTSDPIYAELRLTKRGWTLSVVTTSHGTKVSMRLISPEGDSGFLHHFFEGSIDGYNKKQDRIQNIVESVKFETDCLKNSGLAILEGDSAELERVFDLIIRKHDEWMKANCYK